MGKNIRTMMKEREWKEKGKKQDKEKSQLKSVLGEIKLRKEGSV